MQLNKSIHFLKKHYPNDPKPLNGSGLYIDIYEFALKQVIS